MSDERRALRLWEARFRTQWGGQRRDRPVTWKYDALWRAACWEVSATERAAQGSEQGAKADQRRANEALMGGDG